LTITMLAIAVGLLSISGSLPPNLVSTISAQGKGGVVNSPTPKPKPRSTPRTSTRTSTSSGTPRRTTPPVKPRQIGLPIEMVYVQGGTFLMGSPDGAGYENEHPQHRVSVESFYMGKYEVTQAQYQAVMGTNPSYFKGDDLPVESVSWDDAKEFCRKLSQITGKEYRLPSESEWEYACRAGTTGDYVGNWDAMAWYHKYDSKNSGNKTHPVGQKQPNSFGLYDILGNVPEWCADYYHSSYVGAPTDGSAWLSGDSSYHVLRGGTFYSYAAGLRSAYRNREGPTIHNTNIGLRVVAVSRSS
jgi:formylglycine-generating enzyme required for sulfatase activity